MNLEIRSHYWPNTPHLREIKIVMDGEVICSGFMDKHEIFNCYLALQYSANELLKVSDSLTAPSRKDDE